MTPEEAEDLFYKAYGEAMNDQARSSRVEQRKVLNTAWTTVIEAIKCETLVSVVMRTNPEEDVS